MIRRWTLGQPTAEEKPMRRTSRTSHNKGTGVLLIFFALVIVGVGLLVIRPDMIRQGGTFPFEYWVVMAATSVPLLAFGAVLVWRGMRVDQIYKTGLQGEATVLASDQAAFGLGSGSEHDHSVTPIMKLVLRVTVPGHAPYEAKANEIAPGVRALQMQPGATLPVRVDPKKLSRVVVDWDRSTAATIGHLGVQGLTLPGIQLAGVQLPGAVLPMANPAATTDATAPAPALPVVPHTGAESADSLRATVSQIGLPGTATIDTVMPAGIGPDGRQIFVVGMWVHIGGPEPLRVENAPTAVESHLAHKVAVGAKVPVRVAQVGAAQATVLLWDEA
jgi:hypothetical protein